MQNIEVSNEVYRALMRYSSESGKSASSIIGSLIKNATEEEECKPDKEKLALLESDCARIMRETKEPLSHAEVFRRVL